MGEGREGGRWGGGDKNDFNYHNYFKINFLTIFKGTLTQI